MNSVSVETDGLPSRCPLCGQEVSLPYSGSGYGFCPRCARLLRFDNGTVQIGDPVRRLAELGAFVDVDANGEVRAIRFVGSRYNDSSIHHLAQLNEVPVIDVCETAITLAGVQRLRRLLPNITIRHQT